MNVPEGFCQCGCGEAVGRWEENDACNGRVKGEFKRYINGHATRLPIAAYAEEDRGHMTPCWVWQRGLDKYGYGHVWADGKKQKAHRFYFERERGPIPNGLQLDHLCRTRACVNPDHLEPVTNKQNARRGRNTKLTVDQVAEIKARMAHEPQPDLAAEFGVSTTTISKIKRGGSWADVPAMKLDAPN